MKIETRHTPGPWRASFGNLIRVFPIGSGSPICGVHKTGRLCGEYTTEVAIETRANARLIAAAPRMLEALQDIVEQFEATKFAVGPDLADSIRVFGKELAAGLHRALAATEQPTGMNAGRTS